MVNYIIFRYNITMTAIRPTETELRDKIDADGYNSILNEINSKYTEMDV